MNVFAGAALVAFATSVSTQEAPSRPQSRPASTWSSQKLAFDFSSVEIPDPHWDAFTRGYLEARTQHDAGNRLKATQLMTAAAREALAITSLDGAKAKDAPALAGNWCFVHLAGESLAAELELWEIARELCLRGLILAGFADPWFEEWLRANLTRDLDELGQTELSQEQHRRSLQLRFRRLMQQEAQLLEEGELSADLLAKAGETASAIRLQERLLAVLDARPGISREDRLRVRSNLAVMKRDNCDQLSASSHFERVLEDLERNGPSDGLDVDRVRYAIATAYDDLGDGTKALTHYETLLSTWTPTRSASDPELLLVQVLTAETKRNLADITGARVLAETAYNVLARNHDNNSLLFGLCSNVLSKCLASLGQIDRAITIIEVALATLKASNPPEIQIKIACLEQLATLKEDIGDYRGALPSREEAWQYRCSTATEDPYSTLLTGWSLVFDKLAVGDNAGAKSALESCESVLKRIHDAGSLSMYGSLDSALVQSIATQTFTVLGVMLRTATKQAPSYSGRTPRTTLMSLETSEGLDPNVRRSLEALIDSLAGTEPSSTFESRRLRSYLAYEAGQLRESLALLTAGDSQGSPGPGDPSSKLDLDEMCAYLHARLGNAPEASDRTRHTLRTAREAIARSALAPRELGALAEQHADGLDLALSLLAGCGTLPPPTALAGDTLLAVETLRGCEVTKTRELRRVAQRLDQSELELLRADMRKTSDRISQLALGAARNPTSESRPTSAEGHVDLVRKKEHAERRYAQLVRETEGAVDWAGLSVMDLAKKLDSKSAAASIVRFTHWRFDASDPKKRTHEEVLGALVVKPSGSVDYLSLGPAGIVDDLVESFRKASTSSGSRSESATSLPSSEELGKRLRRILLDPILSSSPSTKYLYLSLDDVLHLVPLDALPLEDGSPLGTRCELRVRISLLDLVGDQGRGADPEPAGPQRLFAIGGLDYDRPADERAAAGRFTTGMGAPLLPLSRDGAPGFFRPLTESGSEVRVIERYFSTQRPENPTLVLTDREATKGAFAQNAPLATFIHLATHGYYAGEDLARPTDSRPSGLPFSTTLSPLVLTGLALSGANLGYDAAGRVPGILTAEEILSLDLSRCRLAVLSACKTSLGVRRAGQGYASLRAAFQGAGTKAVVATLWEVNDAFAFKLMTNFYHRIWVLGQPISEALWGARTYLREELHAPFKEWAGWVLTEG